jgi:hypothetical protein
VNGSCWAGERQVRRRQGRASPILQFPSGIALITIYAGWRYLAADAVVQQHPELFVPVQLANPGESDAHLSREYYERSDKPA